jgi:hypothetical protein
MSVARGFESKDVEFQQAEAERARSTKRALTPEQRQAEAERGIELALARARAEREAAANPHHRRMLDQAIQALEQKLGAHSHPKPA